MTKSLFSLLILLGICLSFSCRKGDIQSTDKVDHGLIGQAKSFFERNIANKTFSEPSSANPIKKLKKSPLWEKAVVKTTPNGNIVCVPLKYEKNIGFSNSSQTAKYWLNDMSFLVLRKDNDDKFTAHVATYIPFNKKSSLIDSKFEGEIQVDDWGGNRVNGYVIKNGKAYTIVNNLGDKSSVSANRMESCMRTDYYWCTRITYGGTTTELGCDLMYSTWSAECYGDPPNEGLEPPGEGSSDFFEYGELEIDPFVVNVTDSCLAKAFRRLLEPPVSLPDNPKPYTDLMRSFFVAVAGPNAWGSITINQTNTYLGSSMLTNSPSANHHTITVNPNHWAGTTIAGLPGHPTQEYWTNSLIHEILHTFMNNVSWGTAMQDNELAQHEWMVRDLIAGMSGIMQGIYPGMSQQHANALALSNMHSVFVRQGSTITNATWDTFIQNNYQMNYSTVVSLMANYLNAQSGTACE